MLELYVALSVVVVLCLGVRQVLLFAILAASLLYVVNNTAHKRSAAVNSARTGGCCGGKNRCGDGDGCCSGGGKKTAASADAAAKRSKAKVIITKRAKSAQVEDETYTKNLVKPGDCHYHVFYSSLTGTSQRVAKALQAKLAGVTKSAEQVKLLNLDDDLEDLDSFFMQTPKVDNLVYILVLPSYESDSPIDYFLEFLKDTYEDFRVDKYPLSKLMGFTVLGLGDCEQYPEKFCYQAAIADKYLAKLGARRIYPLGEVCVKTEIELVDEWSNGVTKMIEDDEPFLLDPNEDYLDSDIEEGEASDGELMDMEDIKGPQKEEEDVLEKKQMVAKDSPTYKSLTKQGYTVVGSHSGVKICRWTKSALRGRGYCYKYAFYGIRSHRCMETTPALSCSNKCVFCWRHGTNPVGTTWRWEVDKPELIINGALEGHYKKIKQMRGVPGVLADRFEEAFKVGHCALSLVGEPIFYPHINEFLDMLHEKDISSFLVCNAQHPDQLEKLNKVTQLYVSIDASSKETLKKVDRPLFRDYWERLQRCLDILRTTQSHQRTVFRLTLVKGFNMDMDEINGYADMVARGLPALIEIKGATFCGSSDGNGNPLTMQNIPFYEECQRFVVALNEELNRRGLEYGLAAEHSHSCCFLIGSNRFKRGDEWYTHIDYDKFYKLWRSGEKFDLMDYIDRTPDWAYFGSKEGGFSPADTRWDRKAEKEKRKLASLADTEANVEEPKSEPTIV